MLIRLSQPRADWMQNCKKIVNILKQNKNFQKMSVALYFFTWGICAKK